MSMYGTRDSGGAGEWMMNAMTRNPEGLLLIAAGAALLMRSARGPSANRYAKSRAEVERKHPGSPVQTQTREGVSDYVAGAAQRAGEYVSEATDRVSETARSYASSAADYADETARATLESSKHLANQARDTADYVVREQPWAVAIAGVLAGAAVAAIFPASRLEQRTLGEAGSRLRSAANAAGEQVMEAGMKAGTRLSEVAQERGLSKEGLQGAAREVGETFTSALAGEEVQNSEQPKPGGEGGLGRQNRSDLGASNPQTARSAGQGSKTSKATGTSSERRDGGRR